MFAAMAVKSGLSEFDALKSITLNPAEILNISHKKGKIEIGLDADIVIWDKNPLDLQSSVQAVYIEGEKVI